MNLKYSNIVFRNNFFPEKLFMIQKQFKQILTCTTATAVSIPKVLILYLINKNCSETKILVPLPWFLFVEAPRKSFYYLLK